MELDRRTVLLLLSAFAAAPSVAQAAPDPIVDAIGREVRLAGPVGRIVLLDATDILSMAVLHPDPSSLVVGWAGVDTLDSDRVRHDYETRPDGSRIQTVGGQTPDSLSIERILTLAPDLVVATARMAPDLGDSLLGRHLEAAGIPLIFSNAASNRQPGGEAGGGDDPFTHLAQTLRMWSHILARKEKTEAFLTFVQEHLDRIRDTLDASAPIKTYLEVQSTYDDCCWAAGQRIWGDLLTQAGGRALSAADAPWYAKISPEQMVIEAPEVYIASGGAYAAGIRPGIGPGLDPAPARAGLRRLIARTGFARLPAVQNKRVHGVWTGLLTVPPLNILFVEIAAKWLHPDLFPDLAPTETLTKINRRFLAKPLPGPCWLSLSPEPTITGQ
ncbi:ABC transporter substrate-binding protein [Rhodospirillum sp. A1_3_36]|uniref:ABC transporter substrate-binding protein n=1 Tax=Rhodospirillum sp. A1_3_36 TaxID=3391666 RepID=UPI0039A72A2F